MKTLAHKYLPWFRKALYLVAIYVGLIFVQYGQGWKDFKNQSLQVLSSGGSQINGRVDYVRGFGFGLHTDYFVKVDSRPDEVMVPATLINPILSGPVDHPLYFAREVRKGNPIYIGTSGGGRPVALEVIVNEPGGPSRTILNYRVSANRYTETVEHAVEIGEYFRTLGFILIPILMVSVRLLPFLLALGLRLWKQRASRGPRAAT